MANKRGWWFFLLLLLSGCYEEQEGCLDVLSSNFNVSADIDCSNCCNYPSLNLSINYPIPPLDSVLQDVNGHSFVVEKLSFYLANVRLLDDIGSNFTLREKVTYDLEDGDGTIQEVEVVNNFMLANAVLPKTVRLGTFRAGGPFSNLVIEMSIPDSLGKAMEGSFDFNHPLSPSNGLLDQGMYHSGRFTLLQTTPDSVRHEYFIEVPPGNTLNFPISFFPDKGSNLDVNLAFDFSIWLAGLDLTTLDSTRVADSYTSQFIQAFQLLNIE
jgi:hypothetical protein